MRKKVIAGNWKMNKLPNETIAFFEEFAPLVEKTDNEVIICAPYTDLFYAILSAQNTNIKIGAQNMHWEETGDLRQIRRGVAPRRLQKAQRVQAQHRAFARVRPLPAGLLRLFVLKTNLK